MEKYSQLPERAVPSSERVKVHACKLYVTRTWTRSFTKFCPLVCSNDAVGAALREEREEHWEMFWFAFPLEWSCLRTHPAAALMSRGIIGQTHRASLENIGGQEWVGPLQTVRAASWYRTQLHDPRNVLQKQLSSPSSQVLHSLPLLPRQWQGALHSPSHAAGEIASTETSVVQKKNPQSLNQESSQRAGGVSFPVSAARDTGQHQQAPLCLGSSSAANWPRSSGLALLAVISDRTEHF